MDTNQHQQNQYSKNGEANVSRNVQMSTWLEDIIVPFIQEKFLSNKNNKVQLIKMLHQHPMERGKKFFEPNFEIKDVTVFVNDDARYMGRTEWCWQDCSQMLCRDVHFWEKWWNSNFSSVGNSLFFKIIQYLLSIYL